MSIYKPLSPSTSKNKEDKNAPRYSSEIYSSDLLQTDSLSHPSCPKYFEQIQPPNIEHELNVAKSIIQQGSFITGDNLFDHLADIIKLVIKERPENIVDYFEELSFNIREQKFKIPENFPWTHFEPIDIGRAKSFINLMNLPYQPNDNEYNVCQENAPSHVKNSPQVTQETIHPIEKLQRKLSLNENVQRLHLYWALCGFGLSSAEVSKLSYALQKVQFNQIIKHARFWGVIYGLKKSYYIVEAQLTQSETDIRFDKMREEVMEKISIFQDRKAQSFEIQEDVNLIPGAQWQNHSEKDLIKMKRHIFGAMPESKNNVIFDTPPEPIGSGLNRRTYFVVNSLHDEWIELPIVQPQQVQISRKIKKFFTGELDADVVSYPTFLGSEKHYLRATIARITSGTYVAPNDYYRRLRRKEIIEVYAECIKTNEDIIDESDGEEEDEELDNDAIIIENEEYKPCPQKLLFPKSWVHVRPNILEQGRISYFDEKKAIEALEKGSGLNLRNEDEMEETNIEEEDIFEADNSTIHESGPALFITCQEDKNEENIKSWTVRNSSTHNKINQLTILRSNLWPGAYSFTFEKYSDSIYFGWGFKYSDRNVSIAQIPPIQADNYTKGFDEVTDPSVQMEQAWRLFHEKNHITEYCEEEIEEEEESC